MWLVFEIFQVSHFTQHQRKMKKLKQEVVITLELQMTVCICGGTFNCECVFVRERVRDRQKAGRWLYSDVRADLFGVYRQGEIKRGCWIDGGEIKGRFWACERMLMELMELRKPISSAWCPSWVMTWINNCWPSHESGRHTLRSHSYI